MYDHSIQQTSMDQPGKVANPSGGQLNRIGKRNIPYPSSRLRIWSSETGSAVPSRVSLLLLQTCRLNLVLKQHGIPPNFRGGVRLVLRPYAIQSVPTLSGNNATAYRCRSLPSVRQHRTSSPQGSSNNGLCLSLQAIVSSWAS